jgi:hypothetical protein
MVQINILGAERVFHPKENYLLVYRKTTYYCFAIWRFKSFFLGHKTKINTVLFVNNLGVEIPN